LGFLFSIFAGLISGLTSGVLTSRYFYGRNSEDLKHVATYMNWEMDVLRDLDRALIRVPPRLL
jgi:hypothetical protein